MYAGRLSHRNKDRLPGYQIHSTWKALEEPNQEMHLIFLMNIASVFFNRGLHWSTNLNHNIGNGWA